MTHENPIDTPAHLPRHESSLPTDRRALLAGIGGLAAGALLAGSRSAHAGPLTPPPGPITSTHKTLTEVEPRIAINSTNTPGDASCLFRITQPGSYYLPSNIQAPLFSTKHGIVIESGGVSIDLMGFRLSGVATSGDGIRTVEPSQFYGIAISNGTIENWGDDGINLSFGLSARSYSSLIENIRALNNGSTGITSSQGGVIRACVAELNGGTGISASFGTVQGCTSRGNASFGIGGALAITDCVAEENGSDGLNASFGGVITNSSAKDNGGSGISIVQSGTIRSCSAYSNDEHGIYASSRCTVLDCTVAFSGRDNISVANGCTVRGVTSWKAGQKAYAAAILVTGSENRIEENNCLESDLGIHVMDPGNFIARNNCGGNSTNWHIAAGNVCLVVQAQTTGAFVGNTGGASPGSTNPNANYTY